MDQINGLRAEQIAIDEHHLFEQPFTESPNIKQIKGWQFTLESDWCFDFSVHGFLCSKNWSMGSVIASGFEIFIEFGYWRLDYLNRYVIKPPAIKIISGDRHAN